MTTSNRQAGLACSCSCWCVHGSACSRFLPRHSRMCRCPMLSASRKFVQEMHAPPHASARGWWLLANLANAPAAAPATHLHCVCEGLCVYVVALLPHHVDAALTKCGHIHFILALQGQHRTPLSAQHLDHGRCSVLLCCPLGFISVRMHWTRSAGQARHTG